MGRTTISTPHIIAPRAGRSSRHENSEIVDDDSTCPICHLLIYRPVTTRCQHTLCEYCMATWADFSISQQLKIVGLDDTMTLLPNAIEAPCPMCRTSTIASPNANKALALKTMYPKTYMTRLRDEQAAASTNESTDSTEPITIYIGNTHSLVKPDIMDPTNKHNWGFFVRPSRTDLIEEVQIFIGSKQQLTNLQHPTFRNHRIIVHYPPYEVYRLGWGTFTIYVSIILKAGYSWMSAEAEDAPDGGKKGKISLEWTLNFEGKGCQGRCRLKVRKEKDGQDLEDYVEREGVMRRWRRQSEVDPDYVPPDEMEM